jgi:hypothetical protein
VEARYPGGTIRTRDAIERSAIVLLGTLVEAGKSSPGPPGARHIDDARIRIERTLTPAGSGVPAVSGTVKVSYTQQVFPQAKAEAPLERGAKFVLFCTVTAPRQLHALKIVPHSEESVRVVASAFNSGGRHMGNTSGDRIA